MEFKPLLTAIKMTGLFNPGLGQQSCPKRFVDTTVTFVYLCNYLLVLAVLISKVVKPHAGQDDALNLRMLAAFMFALQIFNIRTFFSSYSSEISQLIDRFDGIYSIYNFRLMLVKSEFLFLQKSHYSTTAHFSCESMKCDGQPGNFLGDFPSFA